MCHFNSFLSEIWKWEISSLYVKENDSSPKKNALKYNIDFWWSKKYDSYSEALSELERIENTPTFYYKYIELKDKHLIDKNIQLALILSIFILVLLILRIFQNRKYIVLHFLLTLIFLYFYFKLYWNSSKWDEEPIFFIFSMTYMTIGWLIFVKLKLSNNLWLYVKILLVLLFILYLLVLCMIDHRINKILLSPF
jgi:hypothetical protein